MEELKGHIVELSQNRYASNVIEKCLVYNTPEQKQAIINELLLQSEDPATIVADLSRHEFGNYVVQKMLEVRPFAF